MLLNPFGKLTGSPHPLQGAGWRSKLAKFGPLPAMVFLALGIAAGPTLGRAAYLRFRDICVTYMATVGPGEVILGLLLVATVMSVIGGSVVLLGQLLASRRLWRAVLSNRIATPSRIVRLQDRHRLDFQIVCYQDPDLQAFCLGVRRPFIAVSSGLVAALSDAELDAVVLHEAGHVATRDPRRMLFVKVMTGALFYLPLTHAFYERYLVHLEISADRAAVAHVGVQPLASALSKALPTRSSGAPAAVVAGINATAERIRHLASPGEMDPTPPLRRAELLANGLLVTGTGMLGGGLALAANLFARTVLTCPRM